MFEEKIIAAEKKVEYLESLFNDENNGNKNVEINEDLNRFLGGDVLEDVPAGASYHEKVKSFILKFTILYRNVLREKLIILLTINLQDTTAKNANETLPDFMQFPIPTEEFLNFENQKDFCIKKEEEKSEKDKEI